MSGAEGGGVAAMAPLVETLWALRSGQLDLRAYMAAVKARVEAVEGRLEALVGEADRQQRLEAAVEDLLARYPQPEGRPPLFGLLVGVKDILNVDGLLTRAGSNLPPQLFGGPEAAVVSQLRRAGGLVLAKTATTEFAYFEPSKTRNPHCLAHTPGGSSSGSAAAVAAGYCPLALGTQTIGSILRPAAFCGIVGFKPSFGRIPTEGLVYYAPSVDQVGFFAQDIKGLALVASVLCRDWRGAEGKRRPVLGVPEGPYLEQADIEGLDGFAEQRWRLQVMGYQVKSVALFEGIEAINTRHQDLIAAEMAQQHQPWFETHRHRYRPRTREQILRGQQVPAAKVTAARASQRDLRLLVEAAMERHGIDLWICPAAPGEAPKGLDATGDPIMNLPWTHAGLPALSLPAGRGVQGLPLGLQCVAGFGRDEELLAWAAELAEDIKLE